MKARVVVFVCTMAAVVFALPEPARAAPRALSSPLWSTNLSGGALAVSVDGEGAVVTTDSGHVRAVDGRGRTRWQTAVGGLTRGAPATSRDLVLVGADARVVALSRGDGSIRWERPMSTGVTAVALGGSVALAGDHAGNLHAFDASSGATRWSVFYEGDLWSAPGVDVARSVVVAIWHERPAPATRAFELTTGALRWEHRADLFTAAPVVGAGHAFVAMGDGQFSAAVGAYDLTTGEADWAVIVPASFEPGIVPALDERDLVVVDRIGRVTAIDAASGAPRWTRELRERILDTRVVLLPRRVIVTTLSGALLVLDRVSGIVVGRTDARRLGGLPIAVAHAGRGDRVLVAYRLTEPGRLEMRRVR